MTLSVIGNLAILVMLLLFLYRLQQTHVSFTRRVFSGLGLGVLFGWALQLLYGVGSEVLVQTGDYLDLVGSGYVKLLQMIIIPLMTMLALCTAALVWFGVTYHEDKPYVQAELKKMHEDGTYPEKLF